MLTIDIPTNNGVIADKYSKHAAPEFYYDGNPIVSFPFNISGVPQNAKSLALSLMDYDAIPVSGFPWIHWTAANIPATISKMPENASVENPLNMIQGKNSTAGKFVGVTDPRVNQHYIGPTPPNEDHEYTFSVYALDQLMPLSDGYWLNELYHAMQGHILDEAQVSFIGRV